MNPTNPVLLKISQQDRRYTKTEKAICQFISENPPFVMAHSITEIAAQVGVSEAAITRFSKKAGYSGFNELKLLFIHGQSEADNIPPTESPLEYILSDYVTHLKDMSAIIEERMVKLFIGSITKSSRIKFYCPGVIGFLSRYYAHRMMAIGLPAVSYNEVYSIHADAILSKPGELILCISLEGDDDSLISALEAAKRTGATTALLTNYTDSPLARIADITQVIPTRTLLATGRVISPHAAIIFLGDYLFTRIMMSNPDKYISFQRKFESALAGVAKTGK